ncbi:hypothetical protein STENM327S_05060 [Streptomyces tendae]
MTKETRWSPAKVPSAMVRSAGSRSTPVLVASGNRSSSRAVMVPVPQARSRTRGAGPTSASTMSSMIRNRSSRSGMYHSCCRSQLRCQACQSAPAAVVAVAVVVVVSAFVIEPLRAASRNTLEARSAVT